MAGIVFVCTAANHLGLVTAVEERTGRTIPIVNCPKCFSFWATLAYCVIIGITAVIRMLAISFLAAWLAVWLELFMGIIDKIYMTIYEKIYTSPEDTDTVTADPDKGNTADTLP